MLGEISKYYGIVDTDHTGKFQYLLEVLVENSVSKIPCVAMREWLPIRLTIDEDRNGKCVCEQKRLKELYTIKNMLNHETLFPIGSSCIKRFGSWQMNIRMKQLMKKYKEINKYGELEFSYGKYSGYWIKDIIVDREYMTWLLTNRKLSSCKDKNKAYDKLLMYYDLKVNGLEIKSTNVDCRDEYLYKLK